MRTGYQDLRSFCGVLNFQNINLDTLGRSIYLSFDHLVLVQDRIYFTKIYADISSNITLYHTGNHVFFFCIILIEQNFTLFLTDLLKNHVSCILCGDTAELFGFDLLTDDISQLVLLIQKLRFCQADLSIRIFHLLHNSLLCIYMEITGISVDLYTEILFFFSEMALTCSDQRIFDSIQHNILADIFLFFQNLQCRFQFSVHFLFFPP